MKVPLSWLSEYVAVHLPVEEIAHRLTMAGTEVDAIERIGEGWGSAVVVGLVSDVRQHPNADRLTLVTVETGGDGTAPVEVVCGAPNVAVGQKIAYASVGASLIHPRTGKVEKLKRAKIRGVVSEGMVCSERELGLGDDHEGILVLDEAAPVGTPLADHLGDAVLDLDLTPNRPDCLGVVGVAREVAALTGGALSEPPTDYLEEGPEAASQASIRIDDPDLCSRYTATVLQDVKLGPSPEWLVKRLDALGQGSINNVVDITNYVMFELGQPLHAFDLDGVTDRQIIVRRARQGEHLLTLDGEDRELASEMLVIADPEKAIGLAGVMGGANTEIGESTRNVLLESATFDGPNNRATAAVLGMRTEATIRFEKGLRPGLSEVALRRATSMILEIAGGTVAKGILDAWPGPDRHRPTVAVTAEQLRRVLGVEFTPEQVKSTLSSLGFTVKTDEDRYEVGVPYWRPDVTIPEDVAEELARIIGYDKIATTVIATPIPQWEPNPERDLRESVRDALVAGGMQETISYPLTTGEAQQQVRPRVDFPEPLAVTNPLAGDRAVMRTTLRASVLETLVRNARTWRGPIALFEIGRVYLDRGEGLPDEREAAVGVLAGPRADVSWSGEQGEFDFYDAKGAVEGVFAALPVEAQYAPIDDTTFTPGRCASITVEGRAIGVVGEVAQDVLDILDAEPSQVAMFELDISTLVEALSADAMAPTAYTPFRRYPDSIHDLAVVVDESVPAAAALTLAESNRLVVRADVFDVYRGEGVASGRKSLAMRIVYQSGNRTLTADEVGKAETSILRSLERELGAVLRT